MVIFRSCCVIIVACLLGACQLKQAAHVDPHQIVSLRPTRLAALPTSMPGTFSVLPEDLQPMVSGDAACIHFIDVGQANAILIECEQGVVLFDAGEDDDGNHKGRLKSYLEAFFANRPDLNRTIETIFISHNHVDHASALRSVVESFTVHNYVDGGATEGSGTPYTRWLRNNASARHISLRQVTEAEVEQIPSKRGLTGADIDPIGGATDPKFVLLSGQRNVNPGWSNKDYIDQNNHTVTMRFDFGDHSALFTGDMEAPALNMLVGFYAGTSRLDVDVWQVGHHGSSNGTTSGLLNAMSPQYAFICVGNPKFGQDNPLRPFTTYSYGHPNDDIVQLIESKVTESRAAASITAFHGAKKPVPLTVTKGIYATAWDGDVDVILPAHGKIKIVAHPNLSPQ